MKKTKLGMTPTKEISVLTDEKNRLKITVEEIQNKFVKPEGKRLVTLWVDEELYDDFTNVCDRLALSKSKFLRNNMINLVNDNK